MRDDSGYEWEIIELCPNTGKPYVAPKAWAGMARLPGKQGGGQPQYEKQERPIYSTCNCCVATVTMSWIDDRRKRNAKKKSK